MKIFTIGFLAISLALAGCDRGPSRTSAAPESAGIDRDDYEDYVDGRLKEFDLRFDGLEARRNGLNEVERNHFTIDINELRYRKEGLERKFDDMKSVSNDSWLDVKASLDRGLDQLELAYNVVAANNHGSGHAPLEFDVE
jgi:hypothetical protein